MIEIKPIKTLHTKVQVPGSKSYTHRLFIASALSNGPCTVKNALRSEDTALTLGALKQMGVKMEIREDDLLIHGTGGRLAGGGQIYLGNSGTSMRLLASVAALAEGETILTGTDRMKERPLKDLIDALLLLGVDIRSQSGNGCPPVQISGGPQAGGETQLRCAVSSQYLSGLLLIAPLTSQGIDIEITEGPVSKPYIDMTVEVMERLGVKLERQGYEQFTIPGQQEYQAGTYMVEPDASNASYFWAAAAVTGGTVTVKGMSDDSGQGDVKLLRHFEKMGCSIRKEADGLTVTGGPLNSIEVDMADMPDMVPTLAVTAAYASGTTTICNVAHLRAKECDRLDAVATELTKMGVEVSTTEDSISITGGLPKGADIDTYDDHRIAMCFAVAGLRTPDIRIKDEKCVAKSFPNFWDVFNGMVPS